MTPAGRPEIGQPINVRLGANLADRVDALARRFGVSRASMVRSMLEAAWAELDEETITSY